MAQLHAPYRNDLFRKHLNRTLSQSTQTDMKPEECKYHNPATCKCTCLRENFGKACNLYFSKAPCPEFIFKTEKKLQDN